MNHLCFVGIEDRTVQRMLGKLHQDDLSALMNGKIKEKLGIIPEKVKWGGMYCVLLYTYQ